MKSGRLVVLIAMSLGFGSAIAQASTVTQQFSNDYTSNAIYLWSTDPANMIFGTTTFGGSTMGWTAQSNTASELFLSGPVVNAGTGLFNVQFTYQTTPFAFEWAEVLLNGTNATVLGSGSLGWSPAGWSASTSFTHGSAIVPQTIPLPATVWLFGTALVGLAVVGRRNGYFAAASRRA